MKALKEHYTLSSILQPLHWLIFRYYYLKSHHLVLLETLLFSPGFSPILCSPLRLPQKLFSQRSPYISCLLELHPLALLFLVQSLSVSLASGQVASSKTCSSRSHAFFIPFFKFFFNLLNILPSALMFSSENWDPYTTPNPIAKRWSSRYTISFQKSYLFIYLF